MTVYIYIHIFPVFGGCFCVFCLFSSHQVVVAGVVNHPALFHHSGAFPLGVFEGLNHSHQRDVAAGARAARQTGEHRKTHRWIQTSFWRKRTKSKVYSALVQTDIFCVTSPDGSERLVVLLAVRAGTLDVEELVVLLVHAVTAVAVGVAVVHLHRRLGVQTGTGRFCRKSNVWVLDL